MGCYLLLKPKKKAIVIIGDMKEKGIDFEGYTDNDSVSYLNEKNYYMKLASYRKNYDIFLSGSKEGQYIDLKFKYLVELSTIDMHCRYLILKMCLDIEHSLRVKLLNLIENNDKEDGYNIVNEYEKKYKKSYDYMIQKFSRMKDSSFSFDLVSKYNSQFPIWVLVELISFGDLLKFCDLYNHLYSYSIYDNKILNNIREIRNAAAHSCCLIDNLKSKNLVGKSYTISCINDFLLSIEGISKLTRTKKMKNKTINCFISLIYGYNEIVLSEDVKKHRFNELMNLFEIRMKENKEYFKTNSVITSTYRFVYLCLLKIKKDIL